MWVAMLSVVLGEFVSHATLLAIAVQAAPEKVPEKDIRPGVSSKEVMSLRKRAVVPEVDPDSLASSVATKMIQCMNKRAKTMAAICEFCDAIKKPSQLQQVTLLVKEYICFWDPETSSHGGRFVTLHLRMHAKVQACLQTLQDLEAKLSKLHLSVLSKASVRSCTAASKPHPLTKFKEWKVALESSADVPSR